MDEKLGLLTVKRTKKIVEIVVRTFLKQIIVFLFSERTTFPKDFEKTIVFSR